MKRKSFSNIIPSVKTCKGGNCMTHFPQFTKLTSNHLYKVLRNVIEEPKDSYFHKSYKNANELVIAYKKALKLPFLEACELIYQLKNSYIYYDMYIALNSPTVLIFQQCCK